MSFCSCERRSGNAIWWTLVDGLGRDRHLGIISRSFKLNQFHERISHADLITWPGKCRAEMWHCSCASLLWQGLHWWQAQWEGEVFAWEPIDHWTVQKTCIRRVPSLRTELWKFAIDMLSSHTPCSCLWLLRCWELEEFVTDVRMLDLFLYHPRKDGEKVPQFEAEEVFISCQSASTWTWVRLVFYHRTTWWELLWVAQHSLH